MKVLGKQPYVNINEIEVGDKSLPSKPHISFKNLLGFKINNIEVIAYHGRHVQSSGKYKSKWVYLCFCGRCKIATSDAITSGSVKDCGCTKKLCNYHHGYADTPTYNSWNAMKNRCTNPKARAYPTYGKAGITVCDRWLEPEGKGFLNFLEDMGPRPEGTSLNRVDGAKIYSKETCEWATLSVQAFDQRTPITNKSGHKGVCWNRQHNKWEAYITHKWIKINLGIYSNLEDAVEARRKAEVKYFGKESQK